MNEEIRLFIALTVPEKIKNELYESTAFLRDCCSNIKFTEKHNFHITLKFLGNVKKEEVNDIQKKMEVVSKNISVLKFKPYKISSFFRGRSPSTIITMMKSSEDFFSLAEKVELIFPEKRSKHGKKKFKPHITLGRVKARGNLIKKYLDRDLEINEFSCSGIVLFKSQLYKTGPEYTVLKRIPFGGKQDERNKSER